MRGNNFKPRGIIVGQKNYTTDVKLTVCGQSVHPPDHYDHNYVLLLALAVGADRNVVTVLAAFGAEFAVYAADDHATYVEGVLIKLRPEVDGSVSVLVDENARKKHTGTALA